jgi:hypothetical protein
MADPASATATQLANIEASTATSVSGWTSRAREAGKSKHGEILSWLKSEHGLTHGNANALAHAIRQQEAGGPAGADDLLAAQYQGGRAGLRPIHDRLVALARDLGDDVQVVVQKTGVSLRRRRQFALIEVPSARRVRLGLNLKGTDATERLRATGGMCSHGVDLPDPDAVDGEVRGWLTAAYEQAG